jgi:cytochrome c551/c552
LQILNLAEILKFKTMTLKKSTPLALIALAVSLFIGCSSQEDKDKYDHYYGSGSKSREETALVALQNERKNQPAPAPAAAAPAQGAAAPAAGDTAKGGSGDAAAIGQGGAAAAATNPNAAAAPTATPAKRKPVPADVSALLNKHACLACHQPYDKVIGPAYADVAKKKYTSDQIVELVHNPKPEHWPGFPPMAPMAHVPKGDIVVIANWINSL